MISTRPSCHRRRRMLNPLQKRRYREDGYRGARAIQAARGIRARCAAARTQIVDVVRPASRQRRVFHPRPGRRCLVPRLGRQRALLLRRGGVRRQRRLRQPKALSINKIGHALHELDPVFDAFSHGPALGPSSPPTSAWRTPQLWQSMFIFKQPGIGGEVRWHQDATFLHSEPISVTGFWIALEDATVDNGCLWVAPGGHRGPLAPALRARRRRGARRDARRHAVARHRRGACRCECRPARWCASTACCRTTARPTARRTRAMPTRCMPSTAAAAGRATTGCGARRRRAAFEPRRLRSSSGLPRLTARCRCLPNDGRATVPAWDLRFDHARHHGIHNGGLPCP